MKTWVIASLCAVLLVLAAFVARESAVALSDLRPSRARVDSDPPPTGFVEIAFRTQDGLTLRGWYHPPANGATILLAHGTGGSRLQMLPTALMLARHGFGAMLFDFRAHGESDGSWSSSGDWERLDVAAALRYLLGRPGASGIRLGAVGFSMGGVAVSEVAAQDPTLAAIVLESVPPTFADGILSLYPRYRPFAPFVGAWVYWLAGVDTHGVRPIDRLSQISPRPVFLVYGTNDPGFPSASGWRMLAAAREPKSLWVVPGGTHGGFDRLVPDEFERRVVGFFSGALLPESERSSALNLVPAVTGSLDPRGGAPPSIGAGRSKANGTLPAPAAPGTTEPPRTRRSR